MLNIFLCEDNEKQLKFLSDIIDKVILIENFDLHFQIATCNPYLILEEIDKMTGTGIYFLDIDLECDMNGLQLAQAIRKKDPRGFIVFVTSHSEMSYMTFTYKVEAMDFIIKDNPKELHNRIHQCIADAYHKYTAPQNLAQKTFTFHSGDKEYCIPLEDILFFDTSDVIHKIQLHTATKIIEFLGQLKDIEAALDSRFYRSHRSYLINLNHIKEIDRKNRIITMSNQETCLISANQLRNLKK